MTRRMPHFPTPKRNAVFIPMAKAQGLSTAAVGNYLCHTQKPTCGPFSLGHRSIGGCYICGVYLMLRIVYSFTPPGVDTITRSPTLWPNSAFPTGDSLEI